MSKLRGFLFFENYWGNYRNSSFPFVRCPAGQAPSSLLSHISSASTPWSKVMLFILMAGFTTTALFVMNDLCKNFSITSKMTKEKIKVLAHFPVSSCKFLAYFRDCITADKPLPIQHQGNKHNHGFIRAILVYIRNVSQAFSLLWSPLTGPDKWGLPSLWTLSLAVIIVL